MPDLESAFTSMGPWDRVRDDDEDSRLPRRRRRKGTSEFSTGPGFGFDDPAHTGEPTDWVDDFGYTDSTIQEISRSGSITGPKQGERVSHTDDSELFQVPAPNDYSGYVGSQPWAGVGSISEINLEEGYFLFNTDDGRVGSASIGYLHDTDKVGSFIDLTNADTFVPEDISDTYDIDDVMDVIEANYDDTPDDITVDSNWDDLYGEDSTFDPDTATGDF